MQNHLVWEYVPTPMIPASVTPDATLIALAIALKLNFMTL